MADRIRANHLGAADDRYNSILGRASNPACISDGCTPAQMAQIDHWEWSVTNAAVLPAGSGKVAFEDPNYRITLTWDDARDGNADDSFAFEFRP